MTSDNKEFSKNEVFAEAAEKAKASNGRFHLLGLVSNHVLLRSLSYCMSELYTNNQQLTLKLPRS